MKFSRKAVSSKSSIFSHKTLGIISGCVVLIIVVFVQFSNVEVDGNNLNGGNVGSIKDIDENFQPNIRAGVTIDLSGEGISEVPSYIFQRSRLEKLDLSNNHLSGVLQAEVRHLSELQVLNLSNNEFTGVPSEVGQLSNLEVLNLSNNKLTGLPYEIGNLQQLKILDLRGNTYVKRDLAQIRLKLPTTTQFLID